MTKTVNMLSAETFNEASSPLFSQKDGKYTISAKAEKEFSAGMYKASICKEEFDGKTIEINIAYECSGEKTSPRALAIFKDQEGTLIQSDYLRKSGSNMTLTAEIPGGTAEIQLEMFLYCHGWGQVTYDAPVYSINESKPHRIVNIASAYIAQKGTPEGNLQSCVSVIEKCAKSAQKPDILCFTECVLDVGCGMKYYITDNSPEMALIQSRAKSAGMYVIFTAHEEDSEGYRYNTSYLISPRGDISGKYRKVFLTGMGELKGGLTPGKEFPVFDTEFGKIGLMTCWDQWFPEGARELAGKGAEIIFWSTRGFHEPRAVTRAMDNGIYLVVSHPKPENCGIIEPAWGKFEARGNADDAEGYVLAEIDLDKRLVSQYKSFGRNGSNDREVFLNECELF